MLLFSASCRSSCYCYCCCSSCSFSLGFFILRFWDEHVKTLKGLLSRDYHQSVMWHQETLLQPYFMINMNKIKCYCQICENCTCWCSCPWHCLQMTQGMVSGQIKAVSKATICIPALITMANPAHVYVMMLTNW